MQATILFLLPLLVFLATILLALSALFFIVSLFSPQAAAWRDHRIIPWVSRYALHLSFVVALVATLGSLFYSDIMHYAPCKLCWYQRVFMYPQAVLLFVALIKKDKKIFQYLLPLSGIGALIALYHYILQLNPKPFAPCTTVGYAVSCTEKFIMEYGYITIPTMALVGFLLIIAAGMSVRASEKKNS